MNPLTLEDRVARLEKLVEELYASREGSGLAKDWRKTVGMFDGDPVWKEVIEEGRRIREEDRAKARDSA